MRRTFLAALAAICGALAVAACAVPPPPAATPAPAPAAQPIPAAQPTQPATAIHVGRVEGTTAAVALMRSAGDSLVAYVCDGDDVARLLTGTHTDGSLRAADPAGTLTLEATDTPDGVTGTVTIDGAPHPFTAVPAVGDAGFYRAAGRPGGQDVTVGWVRLNDGSAVGGGTADGKNIPAPDLDLTNPNDVQTEAGPIGPINKITDLEELVPARLAVTISDVTFSEGIGIGGIPGIMRFVVSVNRPIDDPLTVVVTPVSGTAQAGVDFVDPGPRTLTFRPTVSVGGPGTCNGTSSDPDCLDDVPDPRPNPEDQVIDIRLKVNSQEEPTERFTLTVEPSSGPPADLSDVGVGTIRDGIDLVPVAG